MRKIICFILLISFAVVCSACDPQYCYLRLSTEEVVGINLIYYDNETPQRYRGEEKPFENFDESKVTVLERVSQEQIKEVFAEGIELTYFGDYNASGRYNAMQGLCIVILLANEEFIVFNIDGGEALVKFNSENVAVDYMGSAIDYEDFQECFSIDLYEKKESF